MESVLGDIFVGTSPENNSSGAFYGFEYLSKNKSESSGGNHGFAKALFDPSKISSEYVNGARLQIPALQTLVCIKF